MKITKIFLGNELSKQLALGKNCEEIAAWMHQFTNEVNKEKDAAAILDQLAIMGAGPEFECSTIELRELAKMLLNNEENILERFMDIVISGDITAGDLNRKVENISKEELGKELLELLATRRSISDIAAWANKLFKKPGIGSENRDILGHLAIMSKFPDTECTFEELRYLAKLYINNADNIPEKFLVKLRERKPSGKKKKK
jgi:hypothetical protein